MGLDFMNEDRRVTRYALDQQKGISGRTMVAMVIHALFGYTGISRFLQGKYITATVQLFLFVCCFVFWGVDVKIGDFSAVLVFIFVTFLWWSMDARMIWSESGGDRQISGSGTYHGNV
ncbi:MAG: hypothetical protein ACKOPM_16135 [Novosphingobium sp.]